MSEAEIVELVARAIDPASFSLVEAAERDGDYTCLKMDLAACEAARRKARAAIEAHKAALVEAGLKIVARAETREMEQAGGDYLAGNYPAAGACWRKMWDAAPAAGGAEDR